MNTEKWSDILQEWKGYEYLEILFIVIVACILFQVIKYLVPRIVSKFRPAYRFYLLPWIPFLRLIIILSAFILIIPIVIKPTKENLLVLLGTTGLAIGFA